MSAPRRNLADSVLARAELFRRGMLFDGVPKYSQPAELPAAMREAWSGLIAAALAKRGQLSTRSEWGG